MAALAIWHGLSQPQRPLTRHYKYQRAAPPAARHPAPHLLLAARARPPLISHPPPSRAATPHMAVLSLGCRSDKDKENAPPQAAASGIAVKGQAMKRPGGGRKAPGRRPPLRDITCLFLAAPCPPPLALADAAAPEAVRPRAGAPDGVPVEQGRRSLRKGFR
ncbi:hypothetical protein BS78_04G104900 [Paspalum vaginatum]|nr:hypothetical protein BS78_04G104900 [Paspalum vaginatum]